MAPNVPAILEAHYGVPMTGAILNTLNIRLDAATIAFILEHGEAKALITDREFAPTIEAALAETSATPIVIDIDDALYAGDGKRLGEIEYEDFIAAGDPDYAWTGPADEWQAISLNYTSGTTGKPKGVVYHHRGAYLNAIGNALGWGMATGSVYLWTLPMFHCNGWCYPWTMAAMGGTQVCLRKVRGGRHLRRHRRPRGEPFLRRADRPQHAGQRARGGTPAARPHGRGDDRGGAAAGLGDRRDGGHGLPRHPCLWPDRELRSRRGLRLARRMGRAAGRRAGTRQGAPGCRLPVLEGLMIGDPETLAPRAGDGATMGETFMRGNIVMKGYLKNPQATEAAFAGGWFHTGDLGVMHDDGYIELKDRAKDVIISGGENISTIEVESVLYRHPAVLEAAVVARPDEKWGETPCAFVTLKDGAEAVDGQTLIAFCRDNMAHFKAPKSVVFGPLPKTSTGKVQKFVLRDRAKEL